MELTKSLLCKFLKVLANKICDVMWWWKMSAWRMEHSDYFPKSHHGWNLWYIWLYILFEKYSTVEFFIGPLLQMFKANGLDTDGCKNIHPAVPLPKHFCLLESFQKKLLQWDLKVGNIVVSLLWQSLGHS